jgi:RNA polymerase sigma-70 factor (ECF subfamily)
MGQFGLWGSQSWLQAGFPAGLHALKACAQAELPAPQASLRLTLAPARYVLLIGNKGEVIADQAGELRNVVGAARAGDGGAFGELHRRFFRMVHAVLLARVPAADVDDLAQEVFLQAWRQLRALRDPMAFGGWLRQIAVYRSADHQRRGHYTEPLDAVAEPVTGRAAGDADSRLLLEEVRRLPEAYRETLLMRFVEGLTGPEIAELTGLTPGSVRVNLHRGVELLRARLKGTT